MVVAAGFAAGLWRLFSLRFASGETYPPYSSLRSDPLGCKALFDSLDRLVTAARNYRARLPEGGGAGTTLFLLGLPSPGERYETADLLELEQFAASGGRVVISFLPRFEPPAGWQPNRPAAG